LLWLAFGLATLWLPKRFYVVLPLSAAVSLTLSVASFNALTKTLTFDLLFFHLRLDALSAVFLFLLGMTSFWCFRIRRWLFPPQSRGRFPLLCLMLPSFSGGNDFNFFSR